MGHEDWVFQALSRPMQFRVQVTPRWPHAKSLRPPQTSTKFLNVRVGSKARIRGASDMGLIYGDELTFESKDRLYSISVGRGRGYVLAREILV
jgi:hypothetical protein